MKVNILGMKKDRSFFFKKITVLGAKKVNFCVLN